MWTGGEISEKSASWAAIMCVTCRQKKEILKKTAFLHQVWKENLAHAMLGASLYLCTAEGLRKSAKSHRRREINL